MFFGRGKAAVSVCTFDCGCGAFEVGWSLLAGCALVGPSCIDALCGDEKAAATSSGALLLSGSGGCGGCACFLGSKHAPKSSTIILISIINIYCTL